MMIMIDDYHHDYCDDFHDHYYDHYYDDADDYHDAAADVEDAADYHDNNVMMIMARMIMINKQIDEAKHYCSFSLPFDINSRAPAFIRSFSRGGVFH